MILRFVPFSEEALECSYVWLREHEIKHLTMTPEITKESQRIWFESLETRKDYWVKAIEADGKLIGAAGLKHIDMSEKKAEYFGYIGEKTLWGNGIGKEMVIYVIEYAKTLGIRTVYLQVADYNEKALHLYKKQGFFIVEKTGFVYEMQKQI